MGELRAGSGSRLDGCARLFRSQLQTVLLFTKGIRLAQSANSHSLEHTSPHKQVNCLPLAASQLLQGFIK